MKIPVGVAEPAWAALDRAAKRKRLLIAAAEVFARDGMQAPMAEVADAAGAGVASIYRLFGSKEELLAALLAQRRDQIAAAAQDALEQPGDRWHALRAMILALAEQQSATDYLGEARVTLAEHPEVLAARRRMMGSLERLVTAARDEGRLRSDATALDLRLVLIAARAARRSEPRHWRRMVELMIDGLDAGRAR